VDDRVFSEIASTKVRIALAFPLADYMTDAEMTPAYLVNSLGQLRQSPNNLYSIQTFLHILQFFRFTLSPSVIIFRLSKRDILSFR
jgi:hypothetical protein